MENHIRFEHHNSNLLIVDELQYELDKTDPRLMIVLRMKEMEDYSTKAIADAPGCSLPRVYQLLEEAKKKAREYLAE